MSIAGKTILVVDDQADLREVWSRALVQAGYRCVTAQDGMVALEQLAIGPVDAVLTDLAMPRMAGVELMRHLRQHDPELPILVVTGAPSVESAIESIDAGVFRYLLKPVTTPDLVRSVGDALRARARAPGGSDAPTPAAAVAPAAVAPSTLLRALDTLWLAMQPIVRPSERRVVAYEALLRTRDPVLPNPAQLLAAAEQLGMYREVGRAVRAQAAALAPTVPAGIDLFINLHACDLLDDQLFWAHGPLHAHAQRIVLEITERASLEAIPDAKARVAELKKLGFRIALDDMGAGYAGLTSFAVLEPTTLKIDMSLVRGVDASAMKQTLIRALVQLGTELDIGVIAEGVETAEERDILIALGCSQFQGYLFARPAAPFPCVTW